MNFLRKLFGSKNPKIQCPRCLGKGHVDANDIKRLKQELYWMPGSRAYCNGEGKVEPAMLEKVDVDTTYLTNDLSMKDRQQIIDQDPEALERGHMVMAQIDYSVHQIIYLHFTCKLNTHQIAGFFLLPAASELRDNDTYEKEEKSLVEYINQVIAAKKNEELN